MWFTSSWDDGDPLDSRLADLLARHGIGATFYCPLNNVEGREVIDAAALRALDGPFEIGSHTLDHAYADRMPLARWRDQVAQGKQRLEDLLGHRVEGFCYPGGRLVAGARTAVQDAGFAYARTGENLRTDCGADAFLMPTTLQFYPHAGSVLLRNWVSRGRWSARWHLAASCLRAADFAARLESALALCLERGGVFHLWGHSWEIDEHGLWPALDDFLRHVAATVPAPRRVGNAAVLRVQGLMA